MCVMSRVSESCGVKGLTVSGGTSGQWVCGRLRGGVGNRLGQGGSEC